MKKNLMTVLIMALVFVNVVLSAVIMITLVPAAKKTNELVATVCSAVELELKSGKTYNVSTIPIVQTELVNLTGEDPMTFTLRDGDDGKAHYVVATVSVTLNKEDSDYAEKQPLIADRVDLLKEIVSNTFLRYSLSDIKSDAGQKEIRDEMLGQMQELFDSEFMVAVNLSAVNYQ